MATEVQITDLWCRSLQEAWSLYRGARINDMKGLRVPRFDNRGLHPESVLIGQVLACQSLFPELQLAEFHPVNFRRGAEDEGYEQFAQQLIEGLKSRARENGYVEEPA